MENTTLDVVRTTYGHCYFELNIVGGHLIYIERIFPGDLQQDGKSVIIVLMWQGGRLPVKILTPVKGCYDNTVGDRYFSLESGLINLPFLDANTLSARYPKARLEIDKVTATQLLDRVVERKIRSQSNLTGKQQVPGKSAYFRELFEKGLGVL